MNRLEHAQVRPGTRHFRRSRWTLSTGLGSESASRCSDVCTRWLLNSCRPTTNPSPAFLVVAMHLRSADRGHLDFPRVKVAAYGGRLFVYAGPSNWNSLPAHLRDNSLSLSSFKRNLKTFLFSFYYASTRSAFGVLFFTKTRYINSLLSSSSLSSSSSSL